MTPSARFSVALHVMLHLADQRDEPMATDRLAECIQAPTPMVRKVLSDLRKAKLIRPVPGADGGWRLVNKAELIKLSDVYGAVGGALLYAQERDGEITTCQEQDAVSDTLHEFFQDAETLLVNRFSRITVSALTGQMRMLRTHLYKQR